MNQHPPPPDLVDMASRYWQSAALMAGVRLGVYAALARRRATAAKLAGELVCSREHLEALLDALCGLEILEKGGGEYGIREELLSLLDPASEESLLEALSFNADLFGMWERLPECVRSGEPVLPGNPHLGGDSERLRRFVRGMHSRAGIMARGLLPHLRFSKGERILDVGGGPGTFSLKLAERDPSLKITVLDLPPVVAAAAEIHAGKAALSSVSFLGGDYHTVEYPADQDAVLYCGALHQEPEEGLPGLWARMWGALRPGGRLVVVDLMLDADRTTPAYSALFQLNMMLMRPMSRTYSVPELEETLLRAGFEELFAREVPGTPYTLLQCRKPR